MKSLTAFAISCLVQTKRITSHAVLLTLSLPEHLNLACLLRAQLHLAKTIRLVLQEDQDISIESLPAKVISSAECKCVIPAKDFQAD